MRKHFPHPIVDMNGMFIFAPTKRECIMEDLTKVVDTFKVNTKGYYVYKGLVNGELVYIGTTIQVPRDRFRWHKANGKAFTFEVIKVCMNADDMLDTEFNLIKKYRPKFNKITNRKQNLNRRLTAEELALRVGDKKWCQSCLKRTAKYGKKCWYC